MERSAPVFSEAAHLPGFSRGRSRRARAACQLCRWRKVRCDARGGLPCSNCVFENILCTPAPKRSRKNSQKSSVHRPPPGVVPRTIPEQPSLEGNVSPPLQSPASASVYGQDASSQSFLSRTLDNQVNMLEESIPGIRTSPWPDPAISQHADSQAIFDRVPTRSVTIRHHSPMVGLPEYVKALPSTMDLEDIEYLRMRGAFVLPEKDLQEACLACYFQYVHPIFPIVDPVKIMSIIKATHPNSNEKLSLLLLQALIFGGCTWVDVRLVRKLGFLSRHAFRKSIHRKMRLLYDADYEDDRTSLIQTFILWTSWFEGPNEDKDSWHWIGVALSMSLSIGLHQAPTRRTMTAADSSLRRRLWWMLVTRDVIASFALSRPPRLADMNHNVPMLSVADFDFNYPLDLLPRTFPSYFPEKQASAQLCISLVQLIKIFGKICKAAYPESDIGQTAVLYSHRQLEGTDSIGCKKKPADIDRLKSCEGELNEWRQGVPDELWHTSSIPLNLSSLEKAGLAHRGMLSMLYYATTMNVHRPQMQFGGSTLQHGPSSSENTQDTSRGLVRFGAWKITAIAADFFQADLISSLSATCITCVILASITHLYDTTCDDLSIQSDAHRRLEQCKAVLLDFSEQHQGGQWGLQIIEYIATRIKHRKHHESEMSKTNNNRVSAVVSSRIDGKGTEGIVRDMNDAHPHDHQLLPSPASNADTRQQNESTNMGHSSESTERTTVAMPRHSLSAKDSEWPSSLDSGQEQPVFDSLSNLLEPDFAWLDFAGGLDNPDGLSWPDLGPIS